MLYNHTLGTPRRSADRLVEVALVVLIAAMLLVAIPLMAGVPAAADLELRPMPAPAPHVVVNQGA